MSSTLQFKIIANDLRIRIKNSEGVLINFDEDGLAVVHQYIENQRDSIPDDDLEQFANAIACFLGETVIARYGGKWKYSHNYNQWFITFGGAQGFYPVHIAQQQLRNTGSESVYAAYASLNRGVA